MLGLIQSPPGPYAPHQSWVGQARFKWLDGIFSFFLLLIVGARSVTDKTKTLISLLECLNYTVCSPLNTHFTRCGWGCPLWPTCPLRLGCTGLPSYCNPERSKPRRVQRHMRQPSLTIQGCQEAAHRGEDLAAKLKGWGWGVIIRNNILESQVTENYKAELEAQNKMQIWGIKLEKFSWRQQHILKLAEY